MGIPEEMREALSKEKPRALRHGVDNLSCCNSNYRQPSYRYQYYLGSPACVWGTKAQIRCCFGNLRKLYPELFLHPEGLGFGFGGQVHDQLLKDEPFAGRIGAER